MSNATVRIIKTELESFKNVKHGEIKYINYTNVEKAACLKGNDLVGIYGQNGSGKTAMIEALDILRNILAGFAVNYNEVEGLIDEKCRTKMTTTFFIDCNEKKYKAEYSFWLTKADDDQQIQISKEELTYWRRGASWKTQRHLTFINNIQSNNFCHIFIYKVLLNKI